MSYRSKTSPVQLYGQDGTDSCSVGARADQNLRTSEPARPPRELYLHSTLAVPRDQIPIVDGFRKPAPLPPRQGDGSSVIVFDLDAHETWLCLPVGALQHFPGHGELV
jgi:hypothetical protein